MRHLFNSTYLSIFDQINANVICEFVFVVLGLALLNFFADYFLKRKIVYITTAILSVAILLFYVFQMNIALLIAAAILVIFIIISFFVNLAEIRSLFANKQRANKADFGTKRKDKIRKIFDKDEVYKNINNAVRFLSENKIGALITIERNDDFEKLGILKNGVRLNCDVNCELLCTIFYPKTRLHDGAVVIRDDKIIAASVYYTPTTRAVNGKFGSRHRAALGISENTDSVTILVSEETGRISIACNGELDSYDFENFYQGLLNVMDASVVSKNKNILNDDYEEDQ